MSASTLAEIRTKSAIKCYEEEVGIPVAGNAKLEEIFRRLYEIYFIHATLGDMKFRCDLPTA